MTTTTTVKQYVGDNGSDGTCFGQTVTSLLGFYGVTPVVQPTTSLQAVATNAASVSVSATIWAFATSTQADALVRLVNQMRSDLVTLGLLKGS